MATASLGFEEKFGNWQINYEGQWTLLIDKNKSKTELKEVAKVSSNVIAKMGKNESVSIESPVKIFLTLRVDIGDIVSIVKD